MTSLHSLDTCRKDRYVELESSVQPRSEYRWMELSMAVRRFVEDYCAVKEQDQVPVIADTLSD